MWPAAPCTGWACSQSSRNGGGRWPGGATTNSSSSPNRRTRSVNGSATDGREQHASRRPGPRRPRDGSRSPSSGADATRTSAPRPRPGASCAFGSARDRRTCSPAVTSSISSWPRMGAPLRCWPTAKTCRTIRAPRQPGPRRTDESSSLSIWSLMTASNPVRPATSCRGFLRGRPGATDCWSLPGTAATGPAAPSRSSTRDGAAPRPWRWRASRR